MSNPTTRPQLTSHNPFRTPHLAPNPTGAPATSSASSYRMAMPLSHTSLAPTPTGMSTVSSAPSYQTVAQLDDHSYDEDAPEALPELTPRMPSRQPLNQPLSYLPPPSNNSGSSQSSAPSSPSTLPRLAPGTAHLPPSSSSPPNNLLRTPDDSDIPESAPPAYSLTPDFGGGETIVEQGPRRPFQRAPEPSLHPPPGHSPKRPLSQKSDFAQDSSNGTGSTSSHGRPTTVPTHRPLVRNGLILVYPETHLCPRCEQHYPFF
jgi:hypothetical protein